ncbi:MAG: NADH-quinone oxidoreductase subunit N [Bacteroidetes bacterium CG02_land_8_20_14_3_00_31_25]|nr:NADH-quinone oxidoreductase subunit N [Bacteroidota bacterium]PIV58774.1 MAG: NADH-quinone oxidoreductase subunit N [Bacteroidetes bacterium CG02_land_8_20_14_3_00_31_25]PIX36208.1 MAG: NADH-quinone oxidoreductase subunit N [Bacteroidetes bacterium CG_4_8_14_3_um_filter_31_14]PIY02059.1 MAG: NADH-quinone oxidoreductase subunit N [Bacteroidetes bacterium CG_4_10_14_3_um_filter_31_20]
MMNLQDFLPMRHEILLVFLMIVIILCEIFISEKSKHYVINISIVLFFLQTIIGFLPIQQGNMFGGMFQNDLFRSTLKNILNIGVLIVFLQSSGWLKKEENKGKISEYFLLLLSTLIGMFFMVSSGDFLMFYLGLELATIPITALAAYERNKSKSAEAGIKLLLISALSTGVLLYGISMIYGTTGSVYFADVAANFGKSSLQILGLIFFVAGMGFKISLVPFHLWTADVYEGAPISITAYLSVISKGAAVFIFMIILYKVFGALFDMWNSLLYVLAVVTMTVGNLFAIRQNNMKRFLAFSSIAQAGFILLGILGSNAMGAASVAYFVLIYIVTNLGAFGVVSAIYNASGKEDMREYNGLYKTNPMLSLVMTLALFSLAGIPPVAGFFGKFFLFTSAASHGYYILVLIAVINATISLYYYLRVIKAMFIDPNDNPIPYFKTDVPARIGLVICVAGIFIVGFATSIYEAIFKFTSLM